MCQHPSQAFPARYPRSAAAAPMQHVMSTLSRGLAIAVFVEWCVVHCHCSGAFLDIITAKGTEVGPKNLFRLQSHNKH
ncbi:hypothetical protein Mapa_011246 [Marchantia paleacea]|nr:hypothetical protein Mapa_011246 [Marchantia paleacea]